MSERRTYCGVDGPLELEQMNPLAHKIAWRLLGIHHAAGIDSTKPGFCSALQMGPKTRPVLTTTLRRLNPDNAEWDPTRFLTINYCRGYQSAGAGRVRSGVNGRGRGDRL